MLHTCNAFLKVCILNLQPANDVVQTKRLFEINQQLFANHCVGKLRTPVKNDSNSNNFSGFNSTILFSSRNLYSYAMLGCNGFFNKSWEPIQSTVGLVA